MKIKRLIVAVIMIVTVACLIHFFWMPVSYVFSGDFLESRFRLPSELAGDSYQAGITKMLICSVIISAVVIPVALAIRWIADMSKQYDKWLFIVFSLITFIFPLSCLIIALHMLLQYVWAMGMTFQRGCGVSISLIAIVAMGGLWLWMTGFIVRKWHPKRNIPVE